MTKILFFGDSITDATRVRGSNDAGRVREEHVVSPNGYGSGFVFLTAAQLYYESPNEYQILNRGIGGDRLPQLYARIQLDVWNENPDVLNILVGFNDMNAAGTSPNFTDIERWGRVYRMLISDTLERCPATKIMICEPFALNNQENINEVKRYASEARKIAKEFGLPFVELQEKLEKAVEKYGLKTCFFDGIHPNLVGSKVISDAWLETFKTQVIKK